MICMPGCFNAGDTIRFFFDTYGPNGESITITGLAVTDIEVYKNDSMTQRASDNGYSLLDTDGIDLDGVTGLHGFKIDTSDNSDAGFWADGSQYLINVNAITIDSQTVRFSYFLPLGYSLRSTTPGRTLDVETTGEAGINFDNIKQASGATVLTNVTVPTVTTLTNDPTGVGTTLSRLSAARAGYLDNLNVGGAVATAAAVANIQNNTFIGTNIPQMQERPDAGSITVPIVIFINDETGSPADATGTPAVALTDDAGNDLSARLSVVSHPATGKYTLDLTVTSADELEGLHWEITATVNTKARRFVATTALVDTTAVDFTSTDRTNLGTILSKVTPLPGDPADASDVAAAIAAAVTAINTNVDVNETKIDATKTVVDAINAALASLATAAALTAVKLVTDRLSAMLAVSGAGPNYQFTADALELAPGGGAGPTGANTLTVTVKNANNDDPLQGVLVTLKTDVGTIYDQKRSDGDGVAVFSADDGDYTLSASGIPLFSSVADQAVVLAADQSEEILMEPLTLPSPSLPENAIGTLTCYDEDLEPAKRIEVTFKLKTVPEELEGMSFYSGDLILTSDSNGLLTGEFVQGAEYQGWRGAGKKVTFTVPEDESPFSLPTLLGYPPEE